MTTMKSASIRHFTLLELMIVIGLLSVVGSFFALRIAGYLQERTYTVEKEVIEARYQLAEKVATLCDTTVTAHLDGNTLTLSSGGRTPDGFKAVMQRAVKLKSKGHTAIDKTYSPYGTSTELKPRYPDEVETTIHPS